MRSEVEEPNGCNFDEWQVKNKRTNVQLERSRTTQGKRFRENLVKSKILLNQKSC